MENGEDGERGETRLISRIAVRCAMYRGFEAIFISSLLSISDERGISSPSYPQSYTRVLGSVTKI
jgi:hypothetical protein